MPNFEYKVVPAPTRGLKAKGVKGTQARFANALQTVMNDLGADGWEYQRTDTLPVEERQGLTGKTTNFQNMLVFRRVLEDVEVEAPVVAALIEDQSEDVIEPVEENVAAQAEHNETDAEPMLSDVEDEIAPETSADERVNETLTSNFAFSWAKRQASPNARKDEDTQHPTE